MLVSLAALEKSERKPEIRGFFFLFCLENKVPADQEKREAIMKEGMYKSR